MKLLCDHEEDTDRPRDMQGVVPPSHQHMMIIRPTLYPD